jgi:hypothetical protein
MDIKTDTDACGKASAAAGIQLAIDKPARQFSRATDAGVIIF